MPATRKPRVLVAGQIPPPLGGQNVMIARILAEFRRSNRLASEHLAFQFTPDFKSVRRGSVSKVIELARVLLRLLAFRLRGPIDLLIYPSGGPQAVPLIRDLLLLPCVLLAARRVTIQFHAAGVAERFSTRSGLLFRLIAFLYRRCHSAIVMTHFNRRDPEFFGIKRIEVIPHELPDVFDAALVRKAPNSIRLLYVGHLCPDKGTPALLRAFQLLKERHPGLVLELVGECLPPMNAGSLSAMIRELKIEGSVDTPGVLSGRAKLEAFGRADLFVFPSVAAYESFGLVLIEAMMWGLPIVVTEWRGNLEVVGVGFDGVSFMPQADLAVPLVEALSIAIKGLQTQPQWGQQNRERFLAHFRYSDAELDYPDFAERLLAGGG